ncbi:MAG: hypothetical protein QOJ99_464 [Bryobacterales bacterium]|nr:hypothetical protein [Bryobacterales bacterium]
MRPDQRRLLFGLTAAIVLAYYLFFTWRSVGLYFDPDDMMNLYLAWSKPLGQVLKANIFFWSDFYRPMGALFYRAIFAAGGFNPLPFRLLCLTIGIVNIALCFWFARLASGSERVAALAVLMFAFHPRLLEVWCRTGVIYDLLCFTFFYAAACLYISARRHGGFPGAGRVAAILVCFICALNTKEMAVALPVILLGYELLFERGGWRRFWLVAVMGAMNIPFFAGKTRGASLLANNPLYRPEYSWDRFGHSWAVYLNYILMRETIVPWSAMAILGVLLAIAVVFRSRQLLLAWLIIVIGTLPVSFIPYRGGFVLYISWAGWVLYAAVVLVAAQDLLLRKWPRYRTALACAVFILVGWRFGKLNLHDQRVDPRHWLYDPPFQVQSMTAQMRALQPVLPRGARMLFLEDAFTNKEWTPYFIMKLAWHDDTLVVDRTKMMDGKVPEWKDYQYVFTYESGRYKQLKP